MIIRKPNYSPRPPASRVAQEKAIEKRKIRAFKLECMHYMDWELAEFYGTLKILGNLTFWCDHCQEWKKKLPKPKPPPLPEEPLFL